MMLLKSFLLAELADIGLPSVSPDAEEFLGVGPNASPEQLNAAIANWLRQTWQQRSLQENNEVSQKLQRCPQCWDKWDLCPHFNCD